MKETKKFKLSKINEVEEALIREVVAKLPVNSLFPEKVAEAKAFLKKAKFPPSFSTQ